MIEQNIDVNVCIETTDITKHTKHQPEGHVSCMVRYYFNNARKIRRSALVKDHL